MRVQGKTMSAKRKTILGKVWYFIWEDNSFLSWLVNIVLAFILVKFIIYPGLGLIFGTNYPVVAVVSGSMEHEESSFNQWWEKNELWYTENGIDKEQFENFPFNNGFNEGDIMVLFGSKPKDIKTGHIIVYESHPDWPPIIHRVVLTGEDDAGIFFKTKGDHNGKEDPGKILETKLLGKAVLKIPYLGWVKIMFTNIIKILINWI